MVGPVSTADLLRGWSGEGIKYFGLDCFLHMNMGLGEGEEVRWTYHLLQKGERGEGSDIVM